MKTPLAPPGTRVLAHNHPDYRVTWAPSDKEGWTIGPAQEHHRCIDFFFPKTHLEGVVKSVTFFHIMAVYFGRGLNSLVSICVIF